MCGYAQGWVIQVPCICDTFESYCNVIVLKLVQLTDSNQSAEFIKLFSLLLLSFDR